ncbi:MAG: HXXEE domain-containing protein [Bacteroidales bacterium]|nr:HXXEE domain-containing protein [Bacteroidales bacterium]
MKANTFLSWWCFRPWQIALDIIGVAFAVVLYMHWSEYNAAQQMFVLIGILIPIHVFEEWWWPAGFHWQYNVAQGSDDPYRYPMCRLSDMVTNTIGCIIFATLGFFDLTGNPFLLAMTGFCMLEIIIHTYFGMRMYQLYKPKGKRTIYGPGSFTAYTCFTALMVWGIMQLMERGVSGTDWLWGIGVLLIMLIVIIIMPEKIFGRKDSPYAFKSAGYFEKFL